MRDPEYIGQELRWYWHEAAGEMGQRSNFGATEAKLQGIYPSGYALRDPNPRALWAASRVGRITRRLHQLDADTRRVLFSAYGDLKPPDVLQPIGPAAGVLLAMDETARAWRSSRTTREVGAWLGRMLRRSKSGKASVVDRMTLSGLIAKAQEALAAAERKYSRCW